MISKTVLAAVASSLSHVLSQMSHYSIDIIDHRSDSIIDSEFLKEAIRRVLFEERVHEASISLALVSDAEIHKVNYQYLNHDFPTDVISFLLNATPVEGSDTSRENIVLAGAVTDTEVKIEGEIIVSTETAIREARIHGWSPAAELLLYVVHGLLHLCGYDDLTDEARPQMRSRERELLAIWGFYPTGLES